MARILAISIVRDSRVFAGFVQEQTKVALSYGLPTTQTDKRILHHAKIDITCAACGNHFVEQASVERHRSEKQHPEVTQTGHYRVMATVKQRHAKPAPTLKRKPIAVRSSHGKDIAHSNVFRDSSRAKGWIR